MSVVIRNYEKKNIPNPSSQNLRLGERSGHGSRIVEYRTWQRSSDKTDVPKSLRSCNLQIVIACSKFFLQFSSLEFHSRIEVEMYRSWKKLFLPGNSLYVSVLRNFPSLHHDFDNFSNFPETRFPGSRTFSILSLENIIISE